MGGKYAEMRTLRHATTNSRAETESSHPLLAKHDRQAVEEPAAAAPLEVTEPFGWVPVPLAKQFLPPHAQVSSPPCRQGTLSTSG